MVDGWVAVVIVGAVARAHVASPDDGERAEAAAIRV
jgi:hypothetical protein